LFSKKTVASLQVKAEVHHGHGHQIATEALKAALTKLDAKHAAKAGLKPGAKKATAVKSPGSKVPPAKGVLLGKKPVAKGGAPPSAPGGKKPAAKKAASVKSKALVKPAVSRGKK
jgi:hypothetical protein